MKKGIIVGMSIGIILILVRFIQPWNTFSINKPLTEEEIIATIHEQYDGEIANIKRLDEEYEVEIRSTKGVYELKLDSQTGEIISLSQTESFPTEEILLSEQQVNEIISSKTDGNIEKVELVEEENTSPVYHAVITKGKETILVTIDAITGSILSMSTENREAITKSISEKQAGEIAIKHVKGGKIDDIELKKNKQTSYYLVEIEFDNEKEANVQVNAISGKIMSVIWDD